MSAMQTTSGSRERVRLDCVAEEQNLVGVERLGSGLRREWEAKQKGRKRIVENPAFTGRKKNSFFTVGKELGGEKGKG